jgi:phosphate transport system substrate-binding protein
MKKLHRLSIAALLSLSLVYAGSSAMIKGSDTIVNLSQKLSESFMMKYPKSSISVTGGGSGTGIAALLNKQCDIANASRKMKKKEYVMAKKKKIKVLELTIAVDALSVIIHPQNKIKSLSTEELSDIFKGSIINWSQLGGPNKPITLYGRQSNSGTFSFFRKAIVRADYSNKMNRMNGNSQIVEAIKHDTTGIGYVGVGYVLKKGKPINGIKILSISSKKGAPAYSPADESAVYNHQYPIARGLFQYVAGKPKGTSKQLLEYTLSDEGQNIIKEMGFYQVKGKWAKDNHLAF